MIDSSHSCCRGSGWTAGQTSPTAGDGTQNLLCADQARAVFAGLAANTLFGACWLDGIVALAIAVWAVIEGRRAWSGQSSPCD